MGDQNEQFNLIPQIEEPINNFIIVHIYNKSETYHITRQILLDSVLTQKSCCLFYHILAKKPNDFNKVYGSFACLIGRNNIEADLYLNVDSKSFDQIIKYIQTGTVITTKFKPEIITRMIDLAAVFGMSNLISVLREHEHES